MFRLEGVGLLFRQKAPKPLTPRPASSDWADAGHGRAGQLAESILSNVAGLKQGSPAHESVHTEGRAAGVGPWEANIAGIPMKERGTIHSV